MRDLSLDLFNKISRYISAGDLGRLRQTSRFFANRLAVDYLETIIQLIDQNTVIDSLVQESGKQQYEMILLKSGQVFVRGKSGLGALALGQITAVDKLTEISDLPPIKQIASCGYRSYFLSHDGAVYFSGKDEAGLALSKEKLYNTPKIIPKLSNIVKICTSRGSSFFIDVKGDVWGCGVNFDKQICPESNDFSQDLIKISTLHDVLNIAPSLSHTIIQCSDKVLSMGANHELQLGLDHSGKVESLEEVKLGFKPQKIAVTNHASFFLDADGMVHACGRVHNRPIGLTNMGPAESCDQWQSLIAHSDLARVHQQKAKELINDIASKKALCDSSKLDTDKPQSILDAKLVFRLTLFGNMNKTLRANTNENKQNSREKKCTIM